MSKKVYKSTPKKSDAAQELILMCHSIRAMRENINQQLDGMLDRINRLLPDDDHHSKKYKNYRPDDWHEFLDF